ncbi:DUF1045 domain-containing protein [Pseudooceanicola aestuarii]|uniref:DUF1045 domain-containing protein n=1 Tax=Pseudooceanicola aestuarii TaxID=2697319 RepID=UPI0013D2A0A2|nr:DUF1045 domain-containing protein [Pseudooceanicola aestuarii]
MPEFNRYAIYYMPEPGPLADFGAAWLGWDAVAGEGRCHPEVPDLPRPVADLTASPRKYGFHGTVKPPFRLTEGTDPATLDRAIAALCAETRPVVLDGLALARLGRFLALVPRGETTALNALAARMVTGLDTFRAPAPMAELARRRAAGLSARQEEMLIRWGYPYVLEDFRFHLTLSGKLTEGEAETLLDTLQPFLTPLLSGPCRIDSLCLVGEDDAGRFHLVARYPLGG